MTHTAASWLSRQRRSSVRAALVAVGAVICGALVTSAVVPSWAGAVEGRGSGVPAVLGGFALGDGVEGLVEPGSGGFSFGLPVAGVSVGWDSRAAGVEGSGFGAGWSIGGLARVEVEGGVRVSPSSGGVYPADVTVPSGLAGYLLGDVVFRQRPVEVPARADGSRGGLVAAFELVELGGVRTFFSGEGDPVVRVDANGNRSDWEWAAGHRLLRATDVSGVSTTLDWSDPGRVRVVTAAGSRTVTGVVELDGGRVVGVVDAVGGRTRVGYTPAGLVERITAVSGAATEVSWQALPDGRAAVDRVRVIEAGTGVELSAREWSAQTGLASGWPGQPVPALAGTTQVGSAVGGGGGGADGYSTTVSDGSSTIVSEFDGLGVLLQREIQVTTGSGSLTVQRQAYTYPDTDAGLAPQYAHPTGVTVTHADATGGQREASESFEFDEQGRMTKQVAQDGTITETTYDTDIAPGGVLPVGLPVVQRVTAPDGLVAETRHELNANRTAHIATETSTGTTDDEDLTRTGRTEFDVTPDGFVTAERVYPQGGEGTPVETTYTKDTDLASGRVTTTTTIAAGTTSEASSTQVVDALHGGVLEETGPAGARVSATYDAVGRPVEQIDPAGNTTRYEYRTVQHHGANATIVTGADQVVTTTTLDVLGRVVEVTDNILDGVATPGHVRVAETRDYPAPGTVRVTDAWGATSESSTDLYGRTVRSVAANGLTRLSIHDDIANTVTTALTPTGQLADAEVTTTARLNTRGQATQTTGTRADGQAVPTTTTTLDGLGRVTETSDGADTTSIGFDPFGNPETTTMTPDSATAGSATGAGTAPMVATRQFDGFGASTAKTLSTGDQARTGGVLTYDELGRARTRTDQAGGTSTQEYTPDGLVAVTTTSYGQTTRNEYHPDTRALTRTETTSPIGTTVTTAYEHDPVTGQLTGVYDPTDRAGTWIRYDHDAWGNTTRTTYPDGNSIEHDYDQHGRQTGITDIAGNHTEYEHDHTGLITSATQTNPTGDLLAQVRYRYDAYGRMTEQARSNGITTTYRYTSTNQISSETASKTDGSILTDRAYVYDTRGNLLTRTDTRPDPNTSSPETTTTTYTYDGYDRLTHSAIHDGPTTDTPPRTTTRYDLTVGGDIHAEHTTDHTGTTTRAFDYGPTGTLTTITTTHPDGTTTTQTQDYDPAGNLTRALDGTTYGYDATNHPVTQTTPDGNTTATGYWATRQRATQTHTDTTKSTVFHWDGTTLLNDTHTSNHLATAEASATTEASATAAYLLGPGRHARTLGTPATTSFYETDQHGNTTELTAPDGTITTSYDYRDYGLTTVHDRTPPAGRGTSASEHIQTADAHRNPFQYAGEYTNPDGTQHLQIRTYDPATMRLNSVDPEPLQNKYHYAGLNPITLADPSGRNPDLPSWAYAVLAGVGLALAGVGFATAISAVATANAIGAMTISTKVVLLGTALASVYDLTATALDTIDVFMPEFLDDETALILGTTSVGTGLLTAVAGLGTRALTRVDINRAHALNDNLVDYEASHLVKWTNRIAKAGQAKLAEMGITVDRRSLARSLHRRIVDMLEKSQTGWYYTGHRNELEKFESMVKAWQAPDPVPPMHIQVVRPIRVGDGLAAKMRHAVAATEFARLWDSSSLTARVRDARDKITRFLQQRGARGDIQGVDPDVHPYAEGRYETGFTYVDQYGDLVVHDNEFFGWGHHWKHALRAYGRDV